MYKIIGMCIKTSYFVTWVVDYLVISEEPVPPEWKEKNGQQISCQIYICKLCTGTNRGLMVELFLF